MSFKSFSTAHGAPRKGPSEKKPEATAAGNGAPDTKVPETKAAPPVAPSRKS